VTQAQIQAKEIALIGKNVTNKGAIVAQGRDNIVMMAAGDSVMLSREGSNVAVDVDMSFSPIHKVDNGGIQGTGVGTVTADGGKVILAAGDIYSTAIEGVETLRAEAFRNITMEGAATATGDIALIADADLQYGGDVTTNGDVTAGGNVDIAGNLIDLNGNVLSTGGDLTITGRTSQGLIFDFGEEGFGEYEPEKYWGHIDVAEGKVLSAAQEVVLKDAFGSGGDEEPPAGEMDLFGHGTLKINAWGGSIQTQGPFGEGVKITVEDLSPAELIMLQADPLNLADYSFGNQNNTDLTLTSNNGSVTAVDSSQSLSGKNENAADQWKSIEAYAYTDITLQGHDASRDITAGTLISYASGFDTGNITVTSDNSKVLLTENVVAHQGSVAVTAIDGGIVSSGHITASDDITLFGEVTADASVDQIFDAENGTLWAKDTLSTITKGTGKLTLAADTLVDLDGIDGTSGDSVDVQDGALTIDGPVDAEGNLRATGVIQITGPAQLAGDVLSTGSGIVFQDDVDADGVGSQVFDAGSGQLIAENGVDIDKSTAGSLTLAGDDGIVLGGNATGTGMTAADSLVFENNVTANGTGHVEDQRLDAGLGALDADGSIAKTTAGNLNIGGDEGIELGGNVETYDGDLTLEDAVTANGAGNQRFDADGIGTDLIAADDIIKTTTGSLTLGAGIQPDAQIELAGDVKTSNGNLILWDKVIANGTGNQVFDADGVGTDLIADDDIIKTTAGNLTLGAGTQPDARIELPGDVTTTDGDLTFWDQVIANGSDSQRFDAVGGKLWATDTITKTTTGNLNLGGDDAIDLDGTVDVDAGSLTIEDDFSAAGDLLASENVTLDGSAVLDGGDQRIDAEAGKLTAKDNITKTTSGSLTLAGETGIYLAGDVSTNAADGTFSMNHLIFEDAVTANGTGDHKDQTFTAAPLGAQAGSSLIAYSTITKKDGGDPGTDLDGGNLTLKGGWQVNIDGEVVVEDGTLTIEADQDIYLGSSVISKGDMILAADADE
ncbi:MAG: beta strand repeat-containing protein, partial [Planctomycetota bacterium]